MLNEILIIQNFCLTAMLVALSTTVYDLITPVDSGDSETV